MSRMYVAFLSCCVRYPGRRSAIWPFFRGFYAGVYPAPEKKRDGSQSSPSLLVFRKAA